MPDTPPEVGSLWLHESGERRSVRMMIFDDELGDCVAGSTPYGFTFTVTLADWLAWEANARRIDA